MGQTERFRQRVWAHRVNSVGKLEEVSGLFEGLELDLVWQTDTGVFDVNHPPAPSIGLSLESYFSSIEEPAKHRYWLDFKNLDSANQSESLKRLKELARRFAIPQGNLVVESTSPELLLPFKQAGFYTSYYLPTDFLRTVADTSNDQLTEQEKQEIARIAQRAISTQVDGVSTYAQAYDFVVQNLPKTLDILLWDIELEHHRAHHLKRINTWLEDPRVKVILVKFASAYDR